MLKRLYGYVRPLIPCPITFEEFTKLISKDENLMNDINKHGFDMKIREDTLNLWSNVNLDMDFPFNSDSEEVHKEFNKRLSKLKDKMYNTDIDIRNFLSDYEDLCKKHEMYFVFPVEDSFMQYSGEEQDINDALESLKEIKFIQ